MAIQRTPDLTGPYGRAWRITAPPLVPDQQATLRAWLLHGAWHPFWTFWEVAVVHLRPIEGVRPPTKRYPEAEYEALIVSIASPPGSPERKPDPDDLQSMQPLLPPDCARQFDGVTDEQAARLADDVVHAIVVSGMSPDSDHRHAWERRIDATVEHLRAGLHG